MHDDATEVAAYNGLKSTEKRNSVRERYTSPGRRMVDGKPG
jgi:hypothetical protein